MAVERSQKIEKLSTEFRAKVGQSSPKAKFQTPISPPNGGRFSPNKNHFSQDCQHYKRHGSAGGCRPPKGVNPKVPHPPIFDPFFRNPLVRSPKSLWGATGYLKCVNLYSGPDLTTGNGQIAYTVFGVFRVWGQNPTRQPGIRPRFLWAPSWTTNGGKNFDPRKPEVGDFWGSHRTLGPPGPAPNSEGGSLVMPFGRTLFGTCLCEILRKSDERFLRKSTLNFFLTNPLIAKK